MEENDDNVEVAKRVKQLENQNLKLKRLLETAVDISAQDLIGTARLRYENQDLTQTISNLEEEKKKLEKELSEMLQKNESGLVTSFRKLEEEHADLQTETANVLRGIDEDQIEIKKLESEDLELRLALMQLEQKKCSPTDKVKSVEETKSGMLKQNSSHLNIPKQSIPLALHEFTDSKLNEDSDDNILITFVQLEHTYKEYIDILEEHTLENKISDLVARNEKLTSEVQSSQCETILHSNTNILNKIKDVKSKLATSIEKNNALLISSNEVEIISKRISEMEKERDAIYGELEDYLQNSSRDISKISKNVSDSEIKLLVHEIEVQKAVLLYNLKMLKLKEETSRRSSKSDVGAKEILAPPSSPASMLQTVSDEITQLYTNDIEACDKSSSFDASARGGHQRLEETVARLENERKLLLKHLNSISGTTSQRYEERQLQTQSELHNTFMREESSQEVVITKNLDDATNQLYTAKDIRLEQRIRELEMENNRIKREVQKLVESVEDYHLPAQALRRRIEELEKKSQSQSHIEQQK